MIHDIKKKICLYILSVTNNFCLSNSLNFPMWWYFWFLSQACQYTRGEKKQFTTLQRNTASSTSFEFHLDYQHICHPPVIYSLFLPEKYEEKKEDKCTCQNVKQVL